MNQKKESIWNQINLKIFIPGVICLMIFICAGVFFPSRFYNILDFIQSVFMSRFKWVYAGIPWSHRRFPGSSR